jgi:phosphatidylglycerol:prolipoprotein diacylglycerol transferase
MSSMRNPSTTSRIHFGSWPSGRGGFVYFGGLLFSFVFFLFYFLKPRERSFLESADFLSPIFALGTGLGRWACFLQGCCFGATTESWWAIHGRYPTQLSIFVWEMILMAWLLWLEKRERPRGLLFAIWLGWSALGRFITEFWRADFRGPLLLGLSVSQILSILIMTISLFLLLFRNNLPKNNFKR